MSAESEVPGQGSEAAHAKEIVPRIAEAWGTSRAYVYKLKKQGCPVHDVEAATRWREEHASRGVGYRSKRGAQVADSGASEVPQSGNERGAASLRKDEKKRDAAELPGGRVLGSLWDSVQAAVAIESEAFRLVQLAQKQQKDAVIAIRIAAYTKAQQGRFDAEERYRKEMERLKVLVPLEEAKKLGRRAYDIMIPLMRAMAKNLGPRVNPSDPLAAVEMISAEVEAIIKAGRGEYEERGELPKVTIEIAEEAEDGTAA